MVFFSIHTKINISNLLYQYLLTMYNYELSLFGAKALPYSYVPVIEAVGTVCNFLQDSKLHEHKEWIHKVLI